MVWLIRLSVAGRIPSRMHNIRLLTCRWLWAISYDHSSRLLPSEAPAMIADKHKVSGGHVL